MLGPAPHQIPGGQNVPDIVTNVEILQDKKQCSRCEENNESQVNPALGGLDIAISIMIPVMKR